MLPSAPLGAGSSSANALGATPVSSTAPANGDMLLSDGSQWLPYPATTYIAANMATGSNPADVDGAASPGVSTEYARADHVHTITAGAVVEAKIGASAVTEGKIGNGAVTEGKIGAGAVTNGKLGADAVTGAKIAPTTFAYGYFAGRNGVGAINLSAAEVGAKVLTVMYVGAGSVQSGASLFETTVSVDEQIQQTDAGDWSTTQFLAFFQTR